MTVREPRPRRARHQTPGGRRPDVILHLPAVASNDAEANFGKGYRVNLDGTRALFDAVRAAHTADRHPPRHVFTSIGA